MGKARILCTFLLQNFSKCIFWYISVLISLVAKLCTGIYGGFTWMFLGCLDLLFQLTAHDKNNLERKKSSKKSYSTKYTYTMVRQTQKIQEMRKLLSGAAGWKPILDDMQMFLVALQYGTINELFIDAFRTAAKRAQVLNEK